MNIRRSRWQSLVATGVAGLKNATQFVAIVFAVPVRPAGTPEDEPVPLAADEAAAEADAGAEVVAGADEDELDELLHAAAVSARQATPAAATSDCHLDRRIFIRSRPPLRRLGAGYQSMENHVLYLEPCLLLVMRESPIVIREPSNPSGPPRGGARPALRYYLPSLTRRHDEDPGVAVGVPASLSGVSRHLRGAGEGVAWLAPSRRRTSRMRCGRHHPCLIGVRQTRAPISPAITRGSSRAARRKGSYILLYIYDHA
jgi:hypothetical protein